MTVCPICNGAGEQTVIVEHALSKRPKVCTRWCLCKKSSFVSESPYNKILAWLGEEYLPLEKIDPQLEFFPYVLPSCPNYYITNTSFKDFCLHIKSIIMKYRFINHAPYIYCCKSIDLLQNFWVRQNDGTSPSLTDVNKFDLLVVTFDTKEKNDQLKTCVSEVVYNRLCVRKPTWIYVPGSGLTMTAYEYSEEMVEYLERFKKVTLNAIDHNPVPIMTKSKKKASTFGRNGK